MFFIIIINMLLLLLLLLMSLDHVDCIVIFNMFETNRILNKIQKTFIWDL